MNIITPVTVSVVVAVVSGIFVMPLAIARAGRRRVNIGPRHGCLNMLGWRLYLTNISIFLNHDVIAVVA